MKTKRLLFINVLLVALILCLSISASYAFDTNMDGWTSAGNGVWEVKEDGLYATNNNGNSLAKSNVVIDGTKSFIYEVTAEFTGHGFGIAFGVVDNENFTAVEINTEGLIYCPRRVNNEWSLWAKDFKPLPGGVDGSDGYTIKFMFDAVDKSAYIFVNGQLAETITDINVDLIKGNLGLQTEVSDAVVTKATYTEVESINLFETNISGWTSAGSGSWEKKNIGLLANNNGGNNLCKTDLVIDGTKSFEYEVTGVFPGHGFGIAFGVVDDENFTAVEINTEGKLYCPRRVDNEWSLWANDFKDLPEGVNGTDGYTIKFVFDAEEKSAEIYVDGILADTISDIDIELIKGNVGLMTEHSDVIVTKAVFIDLSVEPSPPPTEENVETGDYTGSNIVLLLMIMMTALSALIVFKVKIAEKA
ncbi:MAG TPA: hypothetical protein PLI11_10700 [Clostridia bacterium]|nr:hypothetical protein [Clostridia bacterium]